MRGLLREAKGHLDIYLREQGKPTEFIVGKLEDQGGVYALETKSFILASKPRDYKYQVSMQESAVNHAQEKGKTIVIWIDSRARLYFFDPARVLRNNWKNHREITKWSDPVPMLNWALSIEEGTRPHIRRRDPGQTSLMDIRSPDT